MILLKKTILDGILIFIFLILVSLFSDPNHFTDTLIQILPFFFIALFGIVTNFKPIINFIVLFLILFISFSFDPGTVDWTSYLLYAIMSAILAGLFTRLIIIDKKKNLDSELKGTFLTFLHKKMPNASNLTLFISDVLLSIIAMLLLCSIVFSPLNIKSIILIVVTCCYFSFSNVYYNSKRL